MNGFLGIIKPSGISSAQLLNKVKRIVKSENKADAVGHMGTLDPNASGVLVVAIGKSTRLFNYFLDKNKTYETTFKFGVQTTTLDEEGEIDGICEKVPTRQEILANLSKFVGKINQTPPKFSAVKIKGECAYDLARSGVEFDLSPKQVEIFSFKLLKQIDEKSFSFEVVCSSGTYIRSLARDFAKELGSLAIASEIKRTQCGVFNFSNCLKESELDLENMKKKIMCPTKVLPWIDCKNISNLDFKDLLDGKKINVDFESGNYFVRAENGDIMLVEVNSNIMRILVNLKG